nr:hypothetical protein [Tanacetum cinerariifolium]
MLFNNTMKWIEAFVPMDTELVKGSEKAAEGGEKAEEGSSKRAASSVTIVAVVVIALGLAALISIKTKDKGKAKMIELEKPLKRKDQIMIDEEVLKNLKAQMQAELIKEERLARQEEKEINIALIESWDNTQAIMDADYKLAARLQEEERRELSIEEKSRLFVELMDKKKKYFKRIRAEKIKNLEVLWSIVKARFKKTKPADDMDNLLFQTLKTMLKHHVEDNIWKYQQGTAKVLNWKLFDLCGVYCVTTQNMMYYLLVEKMCPFTRNILHQMWNDVGLQVDYKVEMAYDLLRLIRR